MTRDAKERLPETLLELFAQNGYPGTPMNGIGRKFGVTKAALYSAIPASRKLRIGSWSA